MDDVIVLSAPPPLSIDEIAARLRPALRDAGAEAAFVFGSYARGSADAWSDLDLVVVMQTDTPFVERPFALKGVVDSVPVAVDVLVYTPDEFSRGMERGFGVFDTLRREGRRIL